MTMTEFEDNDNHIGESESKPPCLLASENGI
jgi:hypothetical protein